MRKLLMTAMVSSALFGLTQEAVKPAAAAQAGASYVWVKESADKQDALLQEAAAFLEKEGHFYLASVEGDAARVRPLKYVMIVDNKVLFVTSSKKEMYPQLLLNPKVELSRTAADGSAYLRYKGKAVLCSDAAVKAKLLELQPTFGKKFGEDQALFLVEPEMVGIFPMKGGQAKTKSYGK
jgi:uncharacterized pyridoxamine 5'-phosphate oxidase family protein